MKKSFVLLITLMFLIIFSFLLTLTMQTKSLNSNNIINQYLYIQAKNHLEFFISYINTIANLNSIYKIELKDDKFKIIARIEKKNSKYLINIFISSKIKNIRLHKQLIR